MPASKTSTSKSKSTGKSGEMRKETGAGPALAAHAKDAKSKGASGQNPAAATKKKS